MKFLLGFVIFFFITPTWAFLPLSETYRSITLSNGDALEVIPKGNVSQNWVVTKDGTSLMFDRGIWYVAKYDTQGQLVRTEETFVKGAQPVAQAPVANPEITTFAAASASAAASFHFPYKYDLNQGVFTQNIVIIRVAFNNMNFKYSDAEIAGRIFGSTNSVKSYYLANSSNRFSLAPVAEYQGSANDGVIRVTLDEAHPDFGSDFYRARSLVSKALSRASNMLNWSSYDRNGDNWIDPNELGIVLVVAGYEKALGGAAAPTPNVWGHKANYTGSVGGTNFGEYAMFGERHNSNLASIGIIAHELGHLLLDLPDMYGSGIGIGVGNWGLMGTGAWNGGAVQGDSPANMLAWSKQLSRFNSLNKASVGDYNLTLSSQSDNADLLEVPLDTYRHGERLLVEYRRKSSYDAQLPGQGVLITHVNDWMSYGAYHRQSPKYPIAVEEADGAGDLLWSRNRGQQGDLYSSSNLNKSFVAKYPNAYNSKQKMTLKSIGIEGSADVSFELSGEILGDNIGLDEIAPNATIGSNGGTMDTVMKITMPSNSIQIDGIDLFSIGSGRAIVSVYTSFDGTSGFGPISTESNQESIQKGWNRIMFSALKASPNETFYIRIRTQMDSGAPLVIDQQGQASGNTWYRSSPQYIYSNAGFDASARVLYRAKGSKLTALKAPVRGYEKKSGGGGLSYLLLLGFILVLANTYYKKYQAI